MQMSWLNIRGEKVICSECKKEIVKCEFVGGNMDTQIGDFGVMEQLDYNKKFKKLLYNPDKMRIAGKPENIELDKVVRSFNNENKSPIYTKREFVGSINLNPHIMYENTIQVYEKVEENVMFITRYGMTKKK